MSQTLPDQASGTAKPGRPFFPNHLLDQMIVVYIILGIVLTLALLFPFDLAERADPMQAPPVVKPEWYFLGTYQALKYLPIGFGVPLFLLAALALVLWPFLDSSAERRPSRRMRPIAIGMAAGILILALTIWGHFSGAPRSQGKNAPPHTTESTHR